MTYSWCRGMCLWCRHDDNINSQDTFLVLLRYFYFIDMGSLYSLLTQLGEFLNSFLNYLLNYNQFSGNLFTCNKNYCVFAYLYCLRRRFGPNGQLLFRFMSSLHLREPCLWQSWVFTAYEFYISPNCNGRFAKPLLSGTQNKMVAISETF